MDLIITDPPYGVDFKRGDYNDNETFIMDNIDVWFKELFRVLKDNRHLLMFVGTKNIHKFISAGINAGFEYKNIIATRSYNNGCVRAKNNFGFQFQPILLFSKGEGRSLNEVDAIPTSSAWYNDPRNKNPKRYTYQYPNWIKTEWFFATAKRAKRNFHPNEKNLDLLEFLVKTFSDEGETVFDPFMGSGSTGIAAIKNNRIFTGVELSEEYYNSTKERLGKVIENIYEPIKKISIRQSKDL
jgi:DNA modification methylase